MSFFIVYLLIHAPSLQAQSGLYLNKESGIPLLRFECKYFCITFIISGLLHVSF